jgi:outer membrane protein assembly factor BamB
LLIALVLQSGAAEGWPQYRGPAANGTTAEKIQTTWPAGGPRQIWRAATPAGFSTFAVANGRAFTLVLRDVQGVPNEVCIALDSETGKELWAAPLGFAKYDGGGDSGAPGNSGGDGPRSTPATDGERVFVLSGALVLFSLNAETGEVTWKKDLVREHAAKNIAWQNAASPVLEGNLLFVCAGGAGQSLLSFHKITGAVMWKAESDRMTHATPTVATILGHRQVIFLTQAGLVSVVPGTGHVLWRHPFPYRTSTAASPVVGGDIVYCSAGYGVGAAAVRISRQGATWKTTELWRRPNDLINHWSSPVCKDGYIYGLFGFKQWQENPLKCIELATGQEKWSRDGFGQGGTILVDGNVMTLAENGELVLVEGKPDAYRELARHHAVTGKCWNSPAVSNGRAYVRSTKEAVCLDLSVKAAER